MLAAQAGLTTGVLCNSDGMDAESGRRFHCWITDRTIPLDEFCRGDNAIKIRCSLAAFCCILKAALHGLYLSDCHFFSFGVELAETATEHRVVIIDAGSRGICRGDKQKKSWINTAVMHKFWRCCAEESAMDIKIKQLWQHSHDIEDCLQKRQRHGGPGHP